MIAFWALAGVLSAAVASLVLFRAARADAEVEALDPAPILYRRQIAELDDLTERGLLAPTERKSAETEAARRLLASQDQTVESWGGGGSARLAVTLSAVAATAIALTIYFLVGAPGAKDQPFAARMKHWTAADPSTLAPSEMAALLSQLTKTRPTDPEGFRYLALADAASNDPAGAVRALHRALKLAPDRADLWEMLGEALVAQSGGEVSAEARAAFVENLKRDPKSIPARFHLASARIASGDKAGGLADWRALLADMPTDDPRLPALKAAIAGAEGQPKPAALPEGQMTAIRGMVAGLAQRLQSQPDDPPGWIRLVRAYSVLGETAKRDAALKTAQARYAAKPDILQQLAEAAKAEPMK